MANIKEPVKLRRKALKNGNVSLYLAIYVNGERTYEFLKLYLIPESSKEAKQQNKQTLSLANSIKARRIVEIQNGEHGFKTNVKSKVLFFDYFESLMEQRLKKDGKGTTYYTWLGCMRQLEVYEKRRNIALGDITPKWVQGFRDFLCQKAVALGRDGRERLNARSLSANTCQLYFSKLNTALRQAVTDGIIDRSPMLGIKGIGKEETKREYLTMDELRAMAATECMAPALKRAFLFSCLTGLRHSDIEKLTWGEVEEQGGRTRLVFRQKKTGGQEYLDLTAQAVELLGERKGHDERVFGKLPCPSDASKGLLVWAANAGVKKHITFHSARHTFAVMMLTIGADLYTVSKLLGHRDIKTTQIYAKIVDAKKREAVDNIPQIL